MSFADDDPIWRTLCRWRAHPDYVRVSWRREHDGRWRCTITARHPRHLECVEVSAVHRRPSAAAWFALCEADDEGMSGVDLSMGRSYFHPHQRICLP